MRFNLTLSGAPVLFIFLAITLILLAVYLYRRTIPPVPAALRFLCAGLRIIVFIIILVLIFEPLLRLRRIRLEKPQIALMVDCSASMRIRERSGMREAVANALLQSEAIKSWMEGCQISAVSFSDRAIHFSLSDTLIASGTATNITQALQDVLADDYTTPLRGILLLSDGQMTDGGSPHDFVRQSGIPVSSIIIGSDTVQPDLVLTDVVTNTLVYQNHKTPVSVTICGPGFAGQSADISLIQDGNVLNSTTVKVPQNGMQKTVTLPFTPEWTGERAVQVRITSKTNELTLENNQREIFIRARKNKIRTFLWAGSPDADVATLTRLLEADEQIDLMRRTQKQPGIHYEGAFPNLETLRQQDLIILVNVPSRVTQLSQWGDVLSVIRDYRKPVFILSGYSTAFERLMQLGQRLPVTGNPVRNEILLAPRLTAQGGQHAITMNENPDLSSAAVWDKLPPVYSCWKGLRKRAEAEMILEGNISAMPDEPVHSYPLLVAQHLGAEKSALFLGAGLNRWDLLIQGAGRSNEVLGVFVHHITHWLASAEPFKTVRMASDKPVYRVGEAVRLTVQVYSESGQPVVQADVQAQITGPDSMLVRLETEGQGIYRQSFRLSHRGDYRVIAGAASESHSLGADTLLIHVTDFNPEFLNTRANPVLLKQLAALSGGKSGPPDSLNSVLESLNFPKEKIEDNREIRLSASLLLLVILFMVMGLEWLIRRRMGMI